MAIIAVESDSEDEDNDPIEQSDSFDFGLVDLSTHTGVVSYHQTTTQDNVLNNRSRRRGSAGSSSGGGGMVKMMTTTTTTTTMMKPSDELTDTASNSLGHSTSSLQRALSQELSASLSKSQKNKSPKRSSGVFANNNKSPSSDELNNSLGKIPKLEPITTEDVNTPYFIDHTKEIARGTNTIVRKCIHRKSGQRYAIKTVNKHQHRLEYEHMKTEAALLQGLNHPSIIKLIEVYEDSTNLHMILEYCKGGELFDHVMMNHSSTKATSDDEIEEIQQEEKWAAIVVFKVVDAVAYLHEQNIVHRDLKLENILFLNKENKKKKKKKPRKKNKNGSSSTAVPVQSFATLRDANVRLIDFGLARRYNTHHRYGSLKKLSSFVGTKYYVAPEVLKHSYTHACDLWSIGVLAYALLSAKAPFQGRNDQEIFDQILHFDDNNDSAATAGSSGLVFPANDNWDIISEDAKNFIRSLLVKNESSRPTADRLLGHPWMIKARHWQLEMKQQQQVASSTEKEKQQASNNNKRSIFQKVFRRGFGSK